MQYEEALHKLKSIPRFGSKVGLWRIQSLLEKIGNPQKGLKCIHVAGTNGKGSTTTMLSNSLIESGYQTGLFISPYVLCFRERMQLNGEMISEEDFACCAEEVYEQVDFEAEDRLTQFEIEVAIAFLWFKKKKCDYVCLEVGLGGRFDATNAIDPPVLQVITSISLDHVAILGNTIEAITYEKAGIIKGGDTVIYPLQTEEAMVILRDTCKAKQSIIHQPKLSELSDRDEDWQVRTFSYKGELYEKSLDGLFQVYNTITVLEAIEVLRVKGVVLPKEAVKKAIANTFFPARMEVLSKAPFILLDGSHNEDGIRALDQALRSMGKEKKKFLVGAMSDKDYPKMIEMIKTHASQMIAVTVDIPRAIKASVIAEAIGDEIPTLCFEEAREGIRVAMNTLEEDDKLIICGSLYLASEVRPYIKEWVQRKY